MADKIVTTTARDGTADLLKGLAVLFMIQVHIMEQFATPDVYQSTIGKISLFLGGPPCAPVFMAVMGYFLAASSRSLANFIKRGTILFLGGILLNAARSANLLAGIISGDVTLDPWFFILGADILTLAGLSVIFTGVLRSALKNKLILFLCLAIAVAAVTPSLDNIGSAEGITAYFTAFFWGIEEWSYFPVFPWFSYVLAGYAFRLFLQQGAIAKKMDIRKLFPYFIPLMIVVILTLPYGAGIAGNLYGRGGYYHHGILFFGWVVLFMISYLVSMKLLEIYYGNHLVVRCIKWMGREVTLLYVIQWIIIGNLATMLYRTQDLTRITGWFAAIAGSTVLFGFLFLKLRELLRNKNALRDGSS